MLLFNRVLYKSTGGLADLSQNLNEPLAGTEVIAYQSANGAIYFGSDYPFNHRYIDLEVVNDRTARAIVTLWNGSDWQPVAEVIDGTMVGGVSLSRSGVLAWVPDRMAGWFPVVDTSLDIPELDTLKLYSMYWAKVTFSADLNALTEWKYVGHKFVIDSELEVRYPELANTNLMDAFETGKTDWKDQCVLASEDLLRDLVNREIICSENQVLDWRIFNTAAIHKAAEIIYRGLGASYKDKVDAASAAYNTASRLKIYNVDRNDNAELDQIDRTSFMGWHTR